MIKKFLIAGAAALAIGACVSAAPVSATATICVTSVTTGAGQILSQCPTTARPGDRRAVSPGSI